MCVYDHVYVDLDVHVAVVAKPTTPSCWSPPMAGTITVASKRTVGTGWCGPESAQHRSVDRHRPQFAKP